MLKSKLLPQSSSSLEAVEPHPLKGAIKFVFFKKKKKILHPTKQHVGLKVLTENKVFYFSKKALRAGTAPNKWLK